MHQIDRCQHIGIDRLQPFLLVPVGPQTGRRPAGIVDENIRLRFGSQKFLAALLRRHIRRNDLHLDAVGIGDFLCRLAQHRFRAGIQRQVNACFRQLFRNAATEPF
jgi:hypothetical protein